MSLDLLSAPPGVTTWAELDEMDDDDIGSFDTNQGSNNPVTHENHTETEVDSNGIKTVIEFTTNKRGQQVKRVKKIKIEEQEVLVPKVVIDRRSIQKFGKCQGLPPGPEEGKTDIGEEIFVMPTADSGAKEKKQNKPEDSFQLNIVCRKCGKVGDHWTSKCPFRDRLDENENMADVMDQAAAAAAAAGTGDDQGGAAGTGGSTTSGSGGGPAPGVYVPPGMRQGAGGGDRGSSRERDDACTVRVTNISEYTKEADLHDLFRPFGRTSRLFLAKDRRTGMSRGFAFVTYEMREDAAKAIKALNGHGYDHLILKVEWAKPQAN